MNRSKIEFRRETARPVAVHAFEGLGVKGVTPRSTTRSQKKADRQRKVLADTKVKSASFSTSTPKYNPLAPLPPPHTHLLLPVHTRTSAHPPTRPPGGQVSGRPEGQVMCQTSLLALTSLLFFFLPLFSNPFQGGGTDIKAARGVGGEENVLPKIGPIKTEA